MTMATTSRRYDYSSIAILFFAHTHEIPRSWNAWHRNLLHFRPDRRQAGRQRSSFLDRCAGPRPFPDCTWFFLLYPASTARHRLGRATTGVAAQDSNRHGGGRGFGRPRHLGWGCKRAGGGARKMSRMVWGGEGMAEGGFCRACTPCHVRSCQRSFCWWWCWKWKWWKWCKPFLLCSHGPPPPLSVWGGQGDHVHSLRPRGDLG